MVRRIIEFICVYVMLICAFLLWFTGETRASDVFTLRELSIEYRSYSLYSDQQRNMLIYPEPPKDGLDVSLNTAVLGYFGWDSTVHSVTSDAQFRGVGLDMRLYLNLTQEISFGHWHHSQHVLDRASPYMRFPAEDAFFVKIYLFRPKFQEALF
jgi:hypothetical protein